jgi:putative nucleotidyltransferase with HDIG domain
MNKNFIGNKLRASLCKIDSLPAMPEIAQKLLALPLNTEDGEAQLLKLIEQDLQLFARIIGLANSSAMGVGRKITGIQDAAQLLGMKRLKSVAIGIATMSRMANMPAGKHFDPHDLWTHSMTVAIVMNLIAQVMPKRIRPDDNQIFIAGLLHDIGLMVLHYLDPAASDELHRQLRLQPKVPITQIELELFGMTHGEIGALLVRQWHLPEEIVEVVALHHSQDISSVSPANLLVRIANVAEKVLPDFGIAEHTAELIDDSEWAELCIDRYKALEISELANEVAIQIVQLPEKPETARFIDLVTQDQPPVIAEQIIPIPVELAVPPVAAPPGKLFAPIGALTRGIRRLFKRRSS